jgi:hypothetical protein
MVDQQPITTLHERLLTRLTEPGALLPDDAQKAVRIVLAEFKTWIGDKLHEQAESADLRTIKTLLE